MEIGKIARFEGVLLNERVSYEIALFRVQRIVAAFSIGCFEIMNTSFALTRFLIFSLLLLFPMVWGQGGLPASLKPIRQDAEWAVNWWMPRHEEKLAEAKERGEEVDLLFVGDSITDYWAKGLWAERYGRHSAFNLGFSGDRTEHVLWRIENGAFRNLAPKVTVLMIGTNNTGHDEGQPAADTVRGIEAILNEINERLPKTKIILHAVFPRGAKTDDRLRLVNDEINKALPAVAKATGAEFLDINRFFLERDGTLHRNIMPDLLHPNEAGYKLWAEGLAPSLTRYFGEKKAAIPRVISLWPKAVPSPHTLSLVETSEVREKAPGETIIRISNVSNPSIAFYPVKSRRPTQTVLVCPGGAYNILAWDLEGTEVAEWLNSIGVSAAVLKYRVNQNREGALQDAQRALGILRSNAPEWNLDPNRIGVLGFSAGGHLSASLSNHWRERSYSKVDAIDEVSCRPDYTVLVYPAYIGDANFKMVDDFKFDSGAPPAFIVQTQDDKRYFPSAIAYNMALLKANISSELHTFPTGGHGYGIRPSAYPVSGWKDLCRDWLLRVDGN